MYMLSRDHLVSGLNALSRAHALDYFADGHRGAALIAAKYLCQREDIESGAADIITEMADREWAGSDLCAPFPDDTPEPRLTENLLAALTASTDRLRQAGHNVIFPSLALKAMAEVPEAVTPARVAGLCRLVEAFTVYLEPLTGPDVDLPGLDDPTALAEFILAEALHAMRRFEGRGQGWTGHLLTHAQAVMDLAGIGEATAAEHARGGLAIYVRRIRMGPQDEDRIIPEHPPTKHGALTERYWQERRSREIGLGHCFKYPYAFFSLLDIAKDDRLRRRSEEQAYRVL
jgi:hypothetical protein